MRKAYIGIDGVAKAVKKCYVGIDDVAMRVKKAYIGIGGAARPCWSDGQLSYYGKATSLAAGKYNAASMEYQNLLTLEDTEV